MKNLNNRLNRSVFSACCLVSIIVAWITILVGCGYRLAGRGQWPGNIQTVAVHMLENRSSETGLEAVMTNALINELNRRRRGSVVSSENADAYLKGTIESIRWDTIAHRGINTASERRVYATVSLILTNQSGTVLWKRTGLSAEQAYTVINEDKTATIITVERRSLPCQNV